MIIKSQGPHLQRLAKQERNIRQVEEPDNLSGPEAEVCFDLGLWGGPDAVSPSRVCEDRPHCMICGSYYHWTASGLIISELLYRRECVKKNKEPPVLNDSLT